MTQCGPFRNDVNVRVEASSRLGALIRAVTHCGPSRDELESEHCRSFRNELATNTVLARVVWIAMVAA